MDPVALMSAKRKFLYGKVGKTLCSHKYQFGDRGDPTTPTARIRNICSSPKYVTGGWIIQCPIVRAPPGGNIGKREDIVSYPWTVRTRTHGQNWHLWERSVFTNFAIKAIYALRTATGSSWCLCESAAFYQLCHKSNLRFADRNWIQLLFLEVQNVNSDRGFESWPFTGYETMSSLLPMRRTDNWTLDFPTTGRIFGRRADVDPRSGSFGSHGHRIDFFESAPFYQLCNKKNLRFVDMQLDPVNCCGLSVMSGLGNNPANR
jgi:hypothetical protein